MQFSCLFFLLPVSVGEFLQSGQKSSFPTKLRSHKEISLTAWNAQEWLLLQDIDMSALELYFISTALDKLGNKIKFSRNQTLRVLKWDIVCIRTASPGLFCSPGGAWERAFIWSLSAVTFHLVYSPARGPAPLLQWGLNGLKSLPQR